METADEDDDVRARTRERHLPQMPLHQEFLEGMATAQDPLMTRDLEITLRHYNTAIRWDSTCTGICTRAAQTAPAMDTEPNT